MRANDDFLRKRVNYAVASNTPRFALAILHGIDSVVFQVVYQQAGIGTSERFYSIVVVLVSYNWT